MMKTTENLTLSKMIVIILMIIGFIVLWPLYAIFRIFYSSIPKNRLNLEK
jgi:hypothetical protein